MAFLPWEIRVAFPRESQLRQRRDTQPRVHDGCFSVSIIHRREATNPSNSRMDYRIFNVRTRENACACVRGCTDTVRESALKIGSGRKIPSCTGELMLCQRRASPMLYQLSYIPNPEYYLSSITISSQ